MKKENKKEIAEAEVSVEKNEKTEEVVVENATENQTAEENKDGKIGQLLKEMRCKKGKELVDVAQELCIRRVYLAAIEDGDYEKIPEYPYGIGFIRSYADYLGLDGAKIVQMYKDEAEADVRRKSPYFVMEPQTEATVPGKKYLLISLLAIAAVYGGWMAYNGFSEKNDAAPEKIVVVENDDNNDSVSDFPLKVEDYSTVDENAETQAEVPAVNIPETEDTLHQVTIKDESYVAPQENTNKAEEVAVPAEKEDDGIVVKIKEETWIEVKNAEKLYISKVLQAGDSYRIPDDKNLKLSVGKAEGVDITKDGKVIYTVAPNRKINISVDDILAQAQH